MRKAYFLLLLVPPVAIYACGGSTDESDGGSDAASDNTTNTDSSADAGDAGSDGNANDVNAQDVANDVVFNITCRYPYECIDGGEPDAAYPPSSGEVCCGTLTLGGMLPCSLTSLTTQCTAPGSCASDVMLACATDTIRGCKHAAECTEALYGNCCMFQYGDAGAQFCVGDTIAMFGTCLDAGQ
jgi:hypothetical protein